MSSHHFTKHILTLISQAAEERYSNEIIAHAESMKTIETLKRDLVAAQATSRDNFTAAETAKVNLATSESSWKHQREALEKEIADLTARYSYSPPQISL